MKRRWQRLPLTARVALVVAGLMVLLGVLASQQVLSTLGRVQTDRIRELARTHAEALSVALGPLVIREDVWEIYDTLERARRASDRQRIVFTAVADAEGRVLAASDPARAPVGSRFERLAAGASELGALSLSSGQTQLKLIAPLAYEGRQVGRLVSELDVADLIAERGRITRLLILWNAAATAVLVLIGVAATRRMLAPLTQIAERMRLADDTPEPIPPEALPPGENELGNLARTYNAMVQALRMKAEAERRLAERERFVSLGRLASSLAHEINNPLGGLLNATDTVRKYADDPQVVRRSAEILERGLRHLRDVARATLDQNRIDRSGQPARPEDFEDLKLLIEPEIRRRGQRLEWDVALGGGDLGALPSAPLRQIALNLLLNASAAAPRGGRVGLRVRIGEGALQMVVSDTGPGLSPEARKRLLSSEEVPQGRGVGLRLVRELVGRLGGRILLPPGGVGSRIRIVLPLGGAAGDAADDAAGGGAGSEAAAAGPDGANGAEGADGAEGGARRAGREAGDA